MADMGRSLWGALHVHFLRAWGREYVILKTCNIDSKGGDFLYKTIGVLAHVDAGKTTLSEQILYHARAIRAPGRVDHQDTLLDYRPAERRRGITIFGAQASFTLGGTDYYLVDTPGHVDFAAEMERALCVLDVAVVVVSCVEGVQAHTETICQMLAERGIPTFFF
jgi:ribosomal protection tetracycline resistance protein